MSTFIGALPGAFIGLIWPTLDPQSSKSVSQPSFERNLKRDAPDGNIPLGIKYRLARNYLRHSAYDRPKWSDSDELLPYHQHMQSGVFSSIQEGG